MVFCKQLELINNDGTRKFLYGVVIENLPLSFKFKTSKNEYEFSKHLNFTLRDTDIEFKEQEQ